MPPGKRQLMPTIADGIVGGVGGVARFAYGGRRGGVVACQLVEQVRGEPRRCGVVEDQGGGQGESGGARQPVAQFDGGQRVEAQLAELAFHGDGLGRGVRELDRRLGADEVGEQPGAAPPRAARRAARRVPRGTPRRLRPWRAAATAHEAAQERGDAGRGRDRTAGDGQRDDQGLVARGRGVEQREAPFHRDQRYSGVVADAAQVVVLQRGGHAHALFPGAPGQ